MKIILTRGERSEHSFHYLFRLHMQHDHEVCLTCEDSYESQHLATIIPTSCINWPTSLKADSMSGRCSEGQTLGTKKAGWDRANAHSSSLVLTMWRDSSHSNSSSLSISTSSSHPSLGIRDLRYLCLSSIVSAKSSFSGLAWNNPLL